MNAKEFVKSYVVEQSIKRYIGFKSVFTHFDKKTEMDKFIVVMGNETFQLVKGTGLRKNGMPFPPTITEFLLCISTDCQVGEMGFEEFCSEFGLESDSRKAYKMWEDCKENKEKMEKILGPEGYEELLKIEEGE